MWQPYYLPNQVSKKYQLKNRNFPESEISNRVSVQIIYHKHKQDHFVPVFWKYR